MRSSHRPVAGQLGRRWPSKGGGGLQDVLGDVDEHGTGAPGGGDVERLRESAGDVLGVGDQEVVLGDRHGDTADVGFLEGVGADQPAPDLPGDRHDRHRVHLRVGERGDQVRCARPGRCHANPDLAGGLGVPGGGMSGTLFVTHQHMTQPLGIDQRVVHRQDCSARNAEDHLDGQRFERAHHRLSAGHPHRVDSLGERSGGSGGIPAGRLGVANCREGSLDRGKSRSHRKSSSRVRAVLAAPNCGYGSDRAVYGASIIVRRCRCPGLRPRELSRRAIEERRGVLVPGVISVKQ